MALSNKAIVRHGSFGTRTEFSPKTFFTGGSGAQGQGGAGPGGS